MIMRPKTRPSWVMFLVAVLAEQRFTPGECQVLTALVTFTDKNGYCWPSIAAVADRAHCRHDRVRKVLRKARRLGYVIASIRLGKDGKQTSNLYQLRHKPLSEAEPDTEPTHAEVIPIRRLQGLRSGSL